VLNSTIVLKSILPTHHQQKFVNVPDALPESIKLEIEGIHEEKPTKQLKFHFEKDQSMQKSVAMSKSGGNTVYVKRKTVRISADGKLGRKPKFPQEEAFMNEFILSRWDRGIPCTFENVFDQMRSHYRGSTASSEFSKIIYNSSHLRTFISRAMERYRWSNRKVSISQTVPSDWKDRAIDDALHICELFRRSDVDVEIAMDEVFMQFHATKDRVIAPCGVKRTGTVNPVENEKVGFTLVVAAERRSSQLLPPFGIMTGKFGGDLFHEWQSYRQSVLTFNQSHWMTHHTTVMFLTFLLHLFPGKTIGLVWDRSHTHFGDIVDEFVRNHNEKNPKSKIIIAFVEAGMTPIMQVPDICINKPIKESVRNLYYQYRDKILSATNAPKPGEKFKVPREVVWGFVEETFHNINKTNLASRWIAEGFRMCGQDPFWKDRSAFHKHLDSLSENSIYAMMQKNNGPLKLE
jgi:hypothetical protein